jgi:HlyD family secretion protein
MVLHVQRSLTRLPELRTVPLEQRELRIAIATSGTIEPSEVVEVGSLVAGNIVGFGEERGSSPESIEVGARVAKGSVLVQLDSEDYKLALQKAHAARRLADAEVTRLQTQLRQAGRDLERAQKLRDTNSESQFDQVVTAHEMAQSELAIAEARREQTLGQVQQAEINLSRTTIRSPIDGVVIDRRANLGQRVSASGPGLFLLTSDLEEMRVRASVSETDIGKVYVGQPVSFSVDAHREQVLKGRVEKVLLNARMQGNFVTYDVLVAIEGSTASLLPHMTADVQMETVNRQNAWLVPTESLRWWPREEFLADAAMATVPPAGVSQSQSPQEGDTAAIWVPTGDGRVRAVPVRVGIDDGVQTEVMGEGFREDMPVVVGVQRETTLARIIPNVKTLR